MKLSEEILTKYKIGREIDEMEVGAVNVESKEKPTVSKKKKGEKKEEGPSETLVSDQLKTEEYQREENLSSNENTSKSLEEVSKLENATCEAKTILPESKSESQGRKKRKIIDVEIPLKEIKTENETPEQHDQDKQRREMKCKVCDRPRGQLTPKNFHTHVRKCKKGTDK